MLFLGLNNGIANYISVYFWQWTPSDISIFPLAGESLQLLEQLSQSQFLKEEKKNYCTFSFTGTIAISYIPYILRLVDPYFEVQTFPVNGSDALWWVMLMHLCVTDIFCYGLGSYDFNDV